MGSAVPWIVLAAALAGQGMACASGVPASIKDYVHTSWTQREGAPADVRAMAQTPDGWYWLGTSTGVYRFDGMNFEKQPLFAAQNDKSQSVAAFHLANDGHLWVVLSYGGVVELGGTDESHPYSPPGIPPDAVVDLMDEDADHRVWALAANELYRLDANRWQAIAKNTAGLPKDTITGLTGDSAGTLWLFTEDAAYRLPKGQARFEPSAASFPKDLWGSVWKGNDGSFWYQPKEGIYRFIAPGGPDQSLVDGHHFSFESTPRVLDRDGTLWFTDCPVGVLCRYPHAEAVHGLLVQKDYYADKLTLDDNILSGLSMTALVDRNGDLWVGTKAGLDRFRKPLASVVHFPDPLIYFSVTPNQDGSVWVGTASMGFTDQWWSVDGTHTPHAWNTFAGDTTASLRDTDGSILLGGSAGLHRFNGKTMLAIDVPEPMQGRKIQALLRDGAGRLWVAFRNAPVYQLDGKTWISKGNIPALPDSHPIVMAEGDHGSAWFGYTGSEIAVLRGNALTMYGHQSGLQTGSVTSILPGNPVLVGGELGLAVLAGDRFHMLQTNVPGTLTGITGIVLAADGCYWFNTQAGAVRIRAEDVQQAVQDPAFKMPFQLVDTLSGMPGGAQRIRPLPSLVQGFDGRLWFAQMSGLAWLDPREMPSSHPPLRVVIRELISGTQTLSPDQPVDLPVATHGFRMVYTALGSPFPERVTFRYRLRGSGGDWQFAGTNRVANFAGLGPGHYQFELQASEDGALWTSPSVLLPISIAPAFYQTSWFKVLCGLLVLLAVVLVTRWRIHLSNERLQARLQIRHAERERIARDLHDTLLQGVQGLILRVHAAASQLSPQHPVGHSIEQALERAEEILVEGRNRLRDLRLGLGVPNELSVRIAGFAQQCAEDHSATFRICSRDGDQSIDPVVGEEAFLIAREALLNAFRHADARNIQVDVDHGAKGLCIRIRDDGRGIHASIKESLPGSDRWGLVGMRERAATIAAELSIESAEGQGTDVVLSVPARVAYVGKR
jgi:signal transduction histidine kinase/ligand-binding sensor domain-containing protein